MCGIYGILDKTASCDFGPQLQRMGDLVKHRGPDAKGFYINKGNGVYIGHRRLSIIDLSQNANQPFLNKDESVCLVCNGEIYNFKELRDILRQKGHFFISNSDSEVILHAYEEWDIACLEKLRGMFAFAIWDSNKKRLIIARDRFGIKPLYYINEKEYFAFSSEAKAFLSSDGFYSPRLNEDSLKLLLGFPFVPNDNTLLKYVKKLSPAHCLVLDEKGMLLKQYWKLEKNGQFTNLSFIDAKHKLEELLLESIQLHLQADVPIGILLSGGLDSSLVAALAKIISPTNIHTYTVGYDHPWDERKFALQVSKHIGSIHHTIKIDPLEVSNRIEELIWYFDAASTLDGGIFSTFLIMEKLKEYAVKVLLVGEGGDEIFGGYSWFGLSQLPFKLLPGILKNTFYYYAFNRLLFNKRFFANVSYFNKILKEFRNENFFRQVTSFELLCQLPSNYLLKVDYGTMGNSLEARVPYLDHLLVEFVYSLPQQYKLHGKWFNMKKSNEKYILRKVAEKYLPLEIATRKKRGFSLPIPQVLKSNIDKVRGYLLNNNSLALSLFSRGEIERLLNFKIRLYSPIEKEKETLLWKLYLLEVWNSLYIRGRH